MPLLDSDAFLTQLTKARPLALRCAAAATARGTLTRCIRAAAV
jgi:hypothetical protein